MFRRKESQVKGLKVRFEEKLKQTQENQQPEVMIQDIYLINQRHDNDFLKYIEGETFNISHSPNSFVLQKNQKGYQLFYVDYYLKVKPYDDSPDINRILSNLANCKDEAKKIELLSDLKSQIKVEESLGESHGIKANRQIPALQRLTNLIKMITEMANEISANKFPTTDPRNTITRILTPEFFFYTFNALSIAEFERLLHEIEKCARTLPLNTHLLLSTFSVVNKDNYVYNIAVYVVGGDRPLIKTYHKAFRSKLDPQHPGALPLDLYKYSGSSNYEIEAGPADFFVGSHVKRGPNVTITNNGSLFTVTTEGGIEYLQAVDICLDHHIGLAKAKLLKETAKPGYQLLPSIVDHVVTANTVDILNSKKLADSVVHVDAERDIPYGVPPRVSRDKIKKIITNISPSTAVKQFHHLLHVANPPFGNNFSIIVTPPHDVPVASSELLREIKAHNEIVNRNKAERLVKSNVNSVILERIEKELWPKVHETINGLNRLLKYAQYQGPVTYRAVNIIKVRHTVIELIKHAVTQLSELNSKHDTDELLRHFEKCIHDLRSKIKKVGGQRFIKHTLSELSKMQADIKKTITNLPDASKNNITDLSKHS